MRGSGILAAVAVLVALLTSGMAAAEKVTVENPLFQSEFGFAPKALPKRTPAPASLVYEARLPITDATGAPRPMARNVTLRLDRNIVLDFKRFPACKADLEHNDVKAIEALCGTAIVGGGYVEFAMMLLNAKRPVGLSLWAVLVNGGRRGSVRTLYLVTQEEPAMYPGIAMVVMPIRIRLVDDDRFAREARITIPTSSAETVGSLTSLQLTIARKFTRKRQLNAVSAKCPDGKLLFSATAEFADGTSLNQESVRPCTGIGQG